MHEYAIMHVYSRIEFQQANSKKNTHKNDIFLYAYMHGRHPNNLRQYPYIVY